MRSLMIPVILFASAVLALIGVVGVVVLFGSKTTEATLSPSIPRSVATPKPPAPPPGNPWTDAESGPARIGPVSIIVPKVTVQEWHDFFHTHTDRAGKKFVFIRLAIDNTSETRKIEYSGLDMSFFRDKPVLKDDLGNTYNQASVGPATVREQPITQATIYPLKRVDDCLRFQEPVSKAKTLYLELPADAFGMQGTFRFRIPMSMVKQAPREP